MFIFDTRKKHTFFVGPWFVEMQGFWENTHCFILKNYKKNKKKKIKTKHRDTDSNTNVNTNDVIFEETICCHKTILWNLTLLKS